MSKSKKQNAESGKPNEKPNAKSSGTPEAAGDNNPGDGNSVGTNPADPADKKPVVTPQPAKDKDSKETHEAMKHYKKAYPNEKHFLIASDGQVFLPANHMDAKSHQKSLDAKKELVKYEV